MDAASKTGLRRISAALAAAAILGSSCLALAPAASAGPTARTTARMVQRGGLLIGAGTRFYVPPPPDGAGQQISQLASSGDVGDAALVRSMESFPRAVWFTRGTPAQVSSQVQQTMAAAAAQQAVPVLVAYDIPGRDCAKYSAGGALDQASYESWIAAFASGIGSGQAVVILEPDALGNMPSGCGLPSSVYPFTDAARIAELQDAVSVLTANPGTNVYLDGTHSAWQPVGTMTQRLLAAGVQRAQGFFLNVSNFQPTAELAEYGTWISDCIAMVTDPSNAFYNNPSACASQYRPATQGDFSTWGLTSQWYARNLSSAVATTHFVIDTSRNGRGPNSMRSYAGPPYNQPPGVVAALASGAWCNPPGSGLGQQPTAGTGVPLLDAYLWIKSPGQSDGQCDAAGRARAWDYTSFTQPGWPVTAPDQALFDPLWGTDDPAAGTWFGQQALQLAQLASPALPGS